MKVLVIGSRVPYPLRDGGAIATYNLLKGLAECGFEVDFLTLNTRKHYQDEEIIRTHFGFLENVRTYYIDASVKPFPALLNLLGKGSYNIERFIDEGFAVILREMCDKKNYDIIHFEGLFVADYVKYLKPSQIKILRQHNIEFKIWKTLGETLKAGLKRWYTMFLSRRLEQYEKAIHKKFDAVVSITEKDREDTIQELGYKGITKYLPAGIDYMEIPIKNIDHNSVYHIGSMEWMPNQEAMKWFHETIWPLIEKKGPNIHFYMGGKNMPELFKTYDLGNYHVVGEIKDLNEFISDKSILAVPLKSGSGIRIKTLEAMMAGKAVVTTGCGANGLDIRTGENCMIADTAEEFAEAIIRLTEDIALRDRIAENGREFARINFSNESVSGRWLDFYEQLKSKS